MANLNKLPRVKAQAHRQKACSIYDVIFWIWYKAYLAKPEEKKRDKLLKKYIPFSKKKKKGPS